MTGTHGVHLQPDEPHAPVIYLPVKNVPLDFCLLLSPLSCVFDGDFQSAWSGFIAGPSGMRLPKLKNEKNLAVEVMFT